MFPKPCMDCQQLFTGKGERCGECRARVNKAKESNPYRRQRKAILYNNDYRQQARAIKQLATYCHLCNQPFTNRDEISADHLIPGDPLSPLAPAHKTCNSSRGNKPLSQ